MHSPIKESPATQAAIEVAGGEPASIRREIANLGGLKALDAALLLRANRLPHTNISNRCLTLVSHLGRGPGWIIGCVPLILMGGRHGRRIGVRTLAAMWLANAVAQGPLKRAFGRERPIHSIHDHILVGKRTMDQSFPSGHSASSFAAATSLALAYPRTAPLLLMAALSVGFSRVYLGHHYPSDVAGGMILGIAMGTAATRLW